jgi:cob(I)alamin adenosyltransferase
VRPLRRHVWSTHGLASDATSGPSVGDVNDHETVGIGTAARLIGTTERTLRYYEQRGLLPLVEVSAAGHRRYNDSSLRQARRVLTLRTLGLSLSSIGTVLSGSNPNEIAAVLKTQAERLDADLTEILALRERVTQTMQAASTSDTTNDTLDLLEEIAMKIVLTRIYTRTGDGGTTALGGGTRVDKTDSRLEVMGDVDELTSAIGVAIAASGSRDTALLNSIQNDLFDLGADIAASGQSEADGPRHVGPEYVRRIEHACDEANAGLEPPASFVLPGSNGASAALHLARAICRRAERHSWSLPAAPSEARRYLNRLSDLLFIMARAAETSAEPTWIPSNHQPS